MSVPSQFAIVDLETTGMSPLADRITEVAVLRVENERLVDQWSQLVHPEMSIPPAIQALTGISNALVETAPSFAQIAKDLWERLEGCVLVAHNARFDYGFLKNEFRRLGSRYQAPVLCTVRLSRALDPVQRSHSLDALVARHALAVSDRHRALGDAQLVWQLLQALQRRHGAGPVGAAVAKLLELPSLPPQLPREQLDAVPEGPGVYFFYGLNQLPIYIGKSINLRERVLSHFSADHRSAKDLKLSAAIRRIQTVATCGEVGALLREAQWIKEFRPLYNRQLRQQDEALVCSLEAATSQLHWLDVGVQGPPIDAECFGPFTSRAQAHKLLTKLAAESGLCWRLLGLEKRQGACFARQLRKCRGACVGEESLAAHALRLAAALRPYRIKPWPFRGIIGVSEQHPETRRMAIELFDCWRHLGTASDDETLASILAATPLPPFDPDVYRILERYLRRASAGANLRHFPRHHGQSCAPAEL